MPNADKKQLTLVVEDDDNGVYYAYFSELIEV
jgi:hypothetical protein